MMSSKLILLLIVTYLYNLIKDVDVKKNLLNLINDFLQCKVSRTEIESNIKGIDDEYKWNFRIAINDIEKILERNLSKKSIHNFNAGPSWGELFEKIVNYTLFYAPDIYREKVDNKTSIFHYTNDSVLIKKNGMRGSNFLNNKNDNNETIYLLDTLDLPDNIYLSIYNKVSIYRYNSFSHQEIDKYASFKYVDEYKKENRLETTVEQYSKDIKESNASKFTFHGYVRYGLGGKDNMRKFLSRVAQTIPWKLMHYKHKQDFIELITVATSFVKPKCYSSNLYSEEKEYRFLYTDITIDGVPYHKVSMHNEVWSTISKYTKGFKKCDEGGEYEW